LSYQPEGLDKVEYIESQPDGSYSFIVNIVDLKREFKKRNTKRIAFTSIVVLLLLTSLLSFTILNSEAQEITSVKPVTTKQGVEFSPDLSPDGKYVAYVWFKNDSSHDIYIKSLEGGAILQVTKGKRASSPVWSPRGDFLTYFSVDENNNCTVNKIEALTRNITEIGRNCESHMYSAGLSWSSDGESVYFSGKKGDQFVIYQSSTRGGPQSLVVDSLSTEKLQYPRIVGDQLYYVMEEAVASSVLIKLEQGTQTEVHRFKSQILGLALTEYSKDIYVLSSTEGRFQLIKVTEGLPKAEHSVVGFPGDISSFELVGDDEILFSVHETTEYISEESMDKNAEYVRIDSNQREMYGRYAKEVDDYIYLSNKRNG